MKITEANSLRVSRRVFDIFLEKAQNADEDGFSLDGYIDTFNNCRETGLRMVLMRAIYHRWDKEISAFTPTAAVWDNVYIWAFEDRHSDQIVVIVSENNPSHVGMYSEESYEKERKFFNCGEYEDAADYMMKRVKEIYALAKAQKELKTEQQH